MANQRKVPSIDPAPPHRDAEVVRKAEAIFADMGMTPEEAVGIFYKQTALHGEFPITELIPNEEVQAAIKEAREGLGLVRYSGLEDFGAGLGQIMAEVDDAKPDHDVQLLA